MQHLLIWYCSVQAQFIVGVGRSCWLKQGWALLCWWLVRLAVPLVTLVTLELFLRLSGHIELCPCCAFVTGSV